MVVGNESFSLLGKGLRILREEGVVSLLRKVRRKVTRYRLSQGPMLTDSSLQEGKAAHFSVNTADQWLIDNRPNFSKPFFVLLKHLISLNEDLEDVPPLSCTDYESFLRERSVVSNFPYDIPLRQVPENEDIVQFIYAFDLACLDRMVKSVFVGLIAFLVRERGRINLLDFGTGPTCGMYGESGRFLFEEENVETGNITFVGIDDLHKPSGSIFRRATYRQGSILHFEADVQFDFISGHHVLEHCFDWKDVLLHVSRLLKTDGYLYMSFPRFGGFYDSAYRLMSPLDHCASFDLKMLRQVAGDFGLEICLSDTYIDPDNRFNWICNLYPDLVTKELADCFYDLCVRIDSKVPLGFHHYGHYVVLRRIK